MTTINTQIPDFVFKQAQEFAQQQQISLDQLIALALSAQLSAWSSANYLEERAKGANLQEFKAILAQVPDVEPEEYDRLIS